VRRLGLALAGALAGYLAGAFASYFLVLASSSNVHDRSVEAAMTSAFVVGPLGALVAGVAAFAAGGRSRR
jgi:cytochrome bd-type quinol oxidase subunit 2